VAPELRCRALIRAGSVTTTTGGSREGWGMGHDRSDRTAKISASVRLPEATGDLSWSVLLVALLLDARPRACLFACLNDGVTAGFTAVFNSDGP
jgi:hypothetical protein